jgi:hypothetical protein
MNHEEHDELWELLGKARQPKPPAFFAANVMRAVRADAEPKPGFLAWLRAKWVLPAAAGACAAVIAILALRHRDTPPSARVIAVLTLDPTGTTPPAADPLEGIALAAAATPEIAPSLGTLLAGDDNSIWLAGNPSSLY